MCVCVQVMYAILSRLVETSAASDAPEDTKVHTDSAVSFLQLVLDTFEDHHVSPSVTAQFFGMVFCFINGSLLNILLRSDTGENVLTGTCGIRLKDILHILDGWGCRVGLGEELQRYLVPLTSAADLLCTPVKQLTEVRLGSKGVTEECE